MNSLHFKARRSGWGSNTRNAKLRTSRTCARRWSAAWCTPYPRANPGSSCTPRPCDSPTLAPHAQGALGAVPRANTWIGKQRQLRAPSQDQTEEPRSPNVELSGLSERETVVELPWAADTCPCVVKAANRVTSDCWYRRRVLLRGVSAHSSRDGQLTERGLVSEQTERVCPSWRWCSTHKTW